MFPDRLKIEDIGIYFYRSGEINNMTNAERQEYIDALLEIKREIDGEIEYVDMIEAKS